MYQLDRSKCEKVLVSDDKRGWKEGILILTNESGSCITVMDCFEKEFLNGQSFDTVKWKHWKPTPKQEWVMFDSNEELEPYVDCWFRVKNELSEYKVIGFDRKDESAVLMLGTVWVSMGSLYNNYEMKVNGKWQPVGKLKGGE